MKKVFAVVALLFSVSAVLVGEEPAPDSPPLGATVDQAALQEQFAETMTGATLVGYFTTDGREAEEGLEEEKYQLKTVKKLDDGDYWLFEYVYGEDGPPLPLKLQIKWAGDTPVITLTDAGVPGFGTFSARVLFFRGEYAGTWSASDHGGKLFGRVVKPEDAGDGDEVSTDKDAE